MFEVSEVRTEKVYKCAKCGLQFQRKPLNGMCLICYTLEKEGAEID